MLTSMPSSQFPSLAEHADMISYIPFTVFCHHEIMANSLMQLPHILVSDQPVQRVTGCLWNTDQRAGAPLPRRKDEGAGFVPLGKEEALRRPDGLSLTKGSYKRDGERLFMCDTDGQG